MRFPGPHGCSRVTSLTRFIGVPPSHDHQTRPPSSSLCTIIDQRCSVHQNLKGKKLKIQICMLDMIVYVYDVFFGLMFYCMFLELFRAIPFRPKVQSQRICSDCDHGRRRGLPSHDASQFQLVPWAVRNACLPLSPTGCLCLNILASY